MGWIWHWIKDELVLKNYIEHFYMKESRKSSFNIHSYQMSLKLAKS